MKIIHLFESEDREHWLEEIGKSDWRAGAFLVRLIRSGGFFEAMGARSRVLLLTEGERLISFCTFAEKDNIQPTELTPWMGFVYTFPACRGHRYAGWLAGEVERLAREEGFSQIYLSTDHVGLYGKYGFSFLTVLDDMDGKPTRVYVKRVD